MRHKFLDFIGASTFQYLALQEHQHLIPEKMAMNGTATGNDTVPRVAELAAIIKRQTDAVSNFLQENGRPEISQSSHAGPATDLPPHLRMAQNAVLEACDELQALMAGPQASLNRLLSPVVSYAQALL